MSRTLLSNAESLEIVQGLQNNGAELVLAEKKSGGERRVSRPKVATTAAIKTIFDAE